MTGKCEICGRSFTMGDTTVLVWGELIAHERCQIELAQSYDALDTGEPEIAIHPVQTKHQS